MLHDTTEPKQEFTNILEGPKYVEINCTPYATSKNKNIFILTKTKTLTFLEYSYSSTQKDFMAFYVYINKPVKSQINSIKVYLRF